MKTASRRSGVRVPPPDRQSAPAVDSYNLPLMAIDPQPVPSSCPCLADRRVRSRASGDVITTDLTAFSKIAGRCFSLDARPAHADAGADGLSIGPSALRDPLATREKKKVVELSVECRIHSRVPDVEILERPPRVCGEGVPKCRRSCFDREAPLTRKPCSLLPLQAASGASQTSSNLTTPTSPARFATFETFADGRGALDSETHHATAGLS